MNKKTLMWIAIAVVGVGLMGLMAWAIAGEEPPDPSVAFRDVEVTGTALPVIPSGQVDQSIGATAPTVIGEDWEGNRVAIEPDGRPKVVIFLAHWCPHCQREVPVVNSFIDAGLVPEGVDFLSVSIFATPNRVEFPPQNWLEREGWQLPVMADSADSEVAIAYGMSATPGWMVLDGQNRNLGRTSGELSPNEIAQLFTLAMASVEDS